jgi:dynein heavy chain
VPFAKINKNEYFTVSRHGVTYWSVSENHFTALDEWEADYKKYQKIRTIKVFAKYRIAKTFTFWWRTVKWEKYQKNRSTLEKELFIAIPTLVPAILQMRHEICNFIDFKFFDTIDKANWSLQYFLEVQINTCEQVRGLLVAYRQKMKDVLCMLHFQIDFFLFHLYLSASTYLFCMLFR